MIEEISTYIRPVLLNSKPPKKKFVLFADGRSGSELLRSLINSHPDIYCDGEVLNEKVLFPYLYVKSLSAITEKKIYGFKVKLYQVIRQKRSCKIFLSHLYTQDWKIIYLRRLNLLRQAISVLIGKERNKWHDTEKSPLQNLQIYIDFSEFIMQIEGLEKSLRKEQEILKNLPHFKIVYEEDLLPQDKHQATLDKVFDYLGVESVPVKTKYYRTTSNCLSDFIQNYEEFLEFVNKTKYAKFLEN